MTTEKGSFFQNIWRCFSRPSRANKRLPYYTLPSSSCLFESDRFDAGKSAEHVTLDDAHRDYYADVPCGMHGQWHCESCNNVAAMIEAGWSPLSGWPDKTPTRERAKPTKPRA